MCLTLAKDEGEGWGTQHVNTIRQSLVLSRLGRSWHVPRGRAPLKNVLDDLTLFQEQKYGFLAFSKCMIMAWNWKQHGAETKRRNQAGRQQEQQ